MPRHLQHALKVLEEQPTVEHWYIRELLEPDQRRIHEYFVGSRSWYRLGFELSNETCKEVAALSARREDLRSVLYHLINYYPCRAFRRVFRRDASRRRDGDFRSWFERFPDIKDDIKIEIMRKSRYSIDSCLCWARYLDGGDKAWRQVAILITRDDEHRRSDPTYCPHESFLRHDLEQHGVITSWEAEQINPFLIEFEATTLSHPEISFGRLVPPPEVYFPIKHEEAFINAFFASYLFARGLWDDRDTALYSDTLKMLRKKSSWSNDQFLIVLEWMQKSIPSDFAEKHDAVSLLHGSIMTREKPS